MNLIPAKVAEFREKFPHLYDQAGPVGSVTRNVEKFLETALREVYQKGREDAVDYIESKAIGSKSIPVSIEIYDQDLEAARLPQAPSGGEGNKPAIERICECGHGETYHMSEGFLCTFPMECTCPLFQERGITKE